MSRQLGLFLAGAGVLWVVTFALAAVVWFDQLGTTLVCSLTALLLCVVPATLTLLWSHWGLKQSADQQLLVVLGGTGVRMMLVLGAGLLLTLGAPYFQERQLNFWVWILVYYLATLALEMALIVRVQEKTKSVKSDPATPALR